MREFSQGKQADETASASVESQLRVAHADLDAATKERDELQAHATALESRATNLEKKVSHFQQEAESASEAARILLQETTKFGVVGN